MKSKTVCLGVVVIDDQPEVSIDDPSFLFESNEGFQEVTSRRTQKSKQKAALEEALKKSQEQQAQAAAQAKRMDKEAKVRKSSVVICQAQGLKQLTESFLAQVAKLFI